MASSSYYVFVDANKPGLRAAIAADMVVGLASLVNGNCAIAHATPTGEQVELTEYVPGTLRITWADEAIAFIEGRDKPQQPQPEQSP